MKNRLALIAALITMAANTNTFAQSTRIATTITTQENDPTFALGRDFWFAPAQNGTDAPGKYIRLYITSPDNTTAYVEWQGFSKKVPVPSYGIGSFNVPLSWETKSSGTVENKAIHVYDSNADLAVYLMSYSPYSSDGMYCIPTIGWGSDYVVASFESLFEDSNGYVYDYPSEFTITANRDSTVVQITPAIDLRLASVYPDSDSIVVFPKGQKFSVTLDRGQSVQYQAVEATDTTDYDATGTIIHANNPVGVVGGSMSPNIPVNFPYAGFIMDMIPPVRTWGDTYYATNPAQPEGMTGHDFSMYLMISTVPNQVIHRYDSATGDHVEATLGSAYDKYFIEDSSANKWYSNAPFLLVQYLNSASYPDGVNGDGAPSMCCIAPLEGFKKSVVFETPVALGDQSYDNYANIIVRAGDENNTTIDGKKITNYTIQPIDSIYEVFVVPHIVPSAHVVKSDSGVGVYVYGYAYDDSYMWGSGFGNATFNSADTVPPVATVTPQCFNTTVHLADSGSLATKLDEIRLDSIVNMSYKLDTNWFDGAGFDTTGYSLTVIDESKPAVLQVSAFDYAGNRTTITSSYTPEFSFSDIDFGTVPWKGSKVTQSFTVTDTTSTDLEIYSLALDGQYSSSYSFTTSPLLPDTLKTGQTITIFVTFNPSVSSDSVQKAQLSFASDACNGLTVNLSASLSGVAGVAENIAPPTAASLVQLADGRSIRVIIPGDWTPPVRLDIYNILGETVYSSSFDGTSIFNLSNLPREVYFYRLHTDQTTQTQKIIISE